MAYVARLRHGEGREDKALSTQERTSERGFDRAGSCVHGQVARSPNKMQKQIGRLSSGLAADEEVLMSLEVNAPRRMNIPSALELIWTLWRAIAMLTLVRSARPDTIAANDEAVRILSNTASELDDREWAERYLCGMADTDKIAFMRGRQSQC